jgi:hypothetical protein
MSTAHLHSMLARSCVREVSVIIIPVHTNPSRMVLTTERTQFPSHSLCHGDRDTVGWLVHGWSAVCPSVCPTDKLRTQMRHESSGPGELFGKHDAVSASSRDRWHFRIRAPPTGRTRCRSQSPVTPGSWCPTRRQTANPDSSGWDFAVVSCPWRRLPKPRSGCRSELTA